jgi:hypothetical protein
MFDESQRRSLERRSGKVIRKSISDTYRYQGKDDFGSFNITGGPCDVCAEGPALCIGYHEIKLPKGIRVGDTILRDEHCYLGLNCGHYAKFHRQVAHIVDRMEARK